MFLEINAARDCQPDEFQRGINIFFRFRITARQQCSDFHGADSAFKINLTAKRVSGKFFLRNTRQKFFSVNVNGMAAERFNNWNAAFF